MAIEKVQVKLAPEVEDYLIDKGTSLDASQRQELNKAFEAIKVNPDIGFIPALPVATQFVYEHYLGDGLHICIYYDICRYSSRTEVFIRKVSIAMKM